HVALDLGVGRTQPGHEALQRAGGLALIIKRELEELVERVIGLMPEPSENALPPAVTPEQPGVERERSFVREAAFALGEARFNAMEYELRGRLFRERLAQRAFAVPSQFEQLILGDAE